MSDGSINPKIEESWKKALADEFSAPYFMELKKFLVEEKKTQVVYPPGDRIFAAFDYAPFDKVKVVIIGQDPYHGPNQANGLCFSVSDGIKPPPSLMNIYKEMLDELDHPIPASGNLEKWAKQGVLMLNATLTVRRSQAGSHQGKGWEQFTDATISKLSEAKEGLVFILWGRFAQNKSALIDTSRHHIIKSAHPSPFSARNGFFGSKPFSRTNKILTDLGKEPVDWSLN